ncbi:MAG: DUF1329 domain-containing protein [Desulfobacterales bacterium]|nr:DUF1329 domain-containing protein [Desulfobacterales bacterium]
MKVLKISNYRFLIVLMFSFFLVLPGPGISQGAIPDPADVVSGKAELPTIEQLSGGKLKKGDIIDKNNIDLVKEYCSAGTLEAVNQGMKMTVGTNPEPYGACHPSYFEITKKYEGKAILEPDGSVWLEKRGVPWPGGIPFLDPKDGNEVMACVNYAIGVDDYHTDGTLRFVDKNGKVYKRIGNSGLVVWTNTRTNIEPLGSWPGYEDQMYRRIAPLTYPLEVRGQGPFVVRYYNSAEKYDTGFMYFPAFKRTMRISTTNYQDGIGGSDLTHGDARGLSEPFSQWNFKLLRLRYVLIAEFKAPFPYCIDSKPVKELIFDEGQRWPRFGFCVLPMYEVECTPKVKHVYGKKIIYVATAPFAKPLGQAAMMDMYDRQGKLWKIYAPHNGDWSDEWHSAQPWGVFVSDLQSRHTTQFWFNIKYNVGLKANDISFKALLKSSR